MVRAHFKVHDFHFDSDFEKINFTFYVSLTHFYLRNEKNTEPLFPPCIFAKDLNVHRETDITKINYLQKYFNAKNMSSL